jgi:hypothetical protein
MKIVTLTLLFVLISSWVYAGCWYEGQEYQTGSVVGAYECGSDGYWKPQQG